jgi:hypothetical protein
VAQQVAGTVVSASQQHTEPREACFVAIPRHKKKKTKYIPVVTQPLYSLGCSYSENGAQGDMFHNYGGHQMECDGLTPVILTVAGSMWQE